MEKKRPKRLSYELASKLEKWLAANKDSIEGLTLEAIAGQASVAMGIPISESSVKLVGNAAGFSFGRKVAPRHTKFSPEFRAIMLELAMRAWGTDTQEYARMEEALK